MKEINPFYTIYYLSIFIDRASVCKRELSSLINETCSEAGRGQGPCCILLVVFSSASLIFELLMSIFSFLDE